MTHDEIRANLLAAMDGTLDPDALDEIERHMAECADCRMEQVELNRMRRSMDRAEESAEPLKPRSVWGMMGGGGTLRVLLIVVFMITALWALARRRAPAVPPPTSVSARARVTPLGEGVAAGPSGRLARILRETSLSPGDEVSVPPGARVIIKLGGGRSLVLEGPASGGYPGMGGWRHRGGRLLAEAGGLRVSVGASSAFTLSAGAVAVWEEAGETRVALLEGTGSWEGAAAAPEGRVYALAPGVLEPVPVEEALPGWVGALREALSGEDLGAVVPGVTLIPEGR